MQNIILALAFLACEGLAERSQDLESQKRAVASLLLAQSPEAAFNPSVGTRTLTRPRQLVSDRRTQIRHNAPAMFFKGPTAVTQQAVKAEEEPEEKELSIKELLTQYGVIAAGFHFSVWITCLLSVFTLLSLGVDISKLFDALGLGDKIDPNAAGVAGKLAATLGVVEVVGPARLALTVSATPKVSEVARKYKTVRDIEEWINGKVEKVSERFN